MKPSFESIPKCQNSATKEYLAGNVRKAFLMFCFAGRVVLVVVIGKTRVKTQHNDDHCPQNDQ